MIEKRENIGGNAYDEIDSNGILVHKYGPHIFHTNCKEVFSYLSQFTDWRKYEHKVLAKLNGELYRIPINRDTINKLYNKNFTSDEEMEKFYLSVKEKRSPILNSEDLIINKIGKDLFEKFYKNYTIKQWFLEPKKLNASVCGRIPVRTNNDDRYFTDKYQFMPDYGYSKLFKNMVSHPNISIMLNTDYKDVIRKIKFDKMIYTGPIDYYFDYKFGRLQYRSIKFEWKRFEKEYYQPCAQINYVDTTTAFTRTVEHKYLSGQNLPNTTVSIEYPTDKGEPLYPIPAWENILLYNKYKIEADKLNNVIFCGRLAEYKYYNMDQVIANTLNIFNKIVKNGF